MNAIAQLDAQRLRRLAAAGAPIPISWISCDCGDPPRGRRDGAGREAEMASEHSVGFEPADRLAEDRESVRRRFWLKLKRVVANCRSPRICLPPITAPSTADAAPCPGRAAGRDRLFHPAVRLHPRHDAGARLHR